MIEQSLTLEAVERKIDYASSRIRNVIEALSAEIGRPIRIEIVEIGPDKYPIVELSISVGGKYYYPSIGSIDSE